MFDLIEWVIPCLASRKESEKMIETATSARSVFPLPVPSSCSASARLPVPEEDFRWNNVYPPPPPPPPPSSSDCSSQRSAPTGGGETQYTRRLRRALDKWRLQKSRSRDHIDDDGHPGNFWAEFGAPRCEYPPPGHPLYRQPLQQHRYVGGLGANTWAPEGGAGGGWVGGVGTGCDVSQATMTTSGFRGGAEEEEEEEGEENFVSPPKITPFGGRIITANDHSILKPVPYKPVTVPVAVPVPCSSSSSSSFDRSNFRKVFSHDSSLDRVVKATPPSSLATVAPDDGYASREWQNLSWPSPSSPRHRRRGISFTQTPSPSDSGVGEVGALLREREAELLALRERMERNERAMMEVFEERRRRWERETGDVIDRWRVKVEGQQQRSFRAEQSLMLQIFRLQQENRKLTEEKNKNAVKNRKEEEEQRTAEMEEPEEEEEQEELVLERNRLKAEAEVLRSQLRDAVEETARKSAELICAQLVLKDNEIEKDSKNAEIRTLLADVDRLKRHLEHRPDKAGQCRTIPDKAGQTRTIPDNAGQSRTIPDNAGQSRTNPDKAGFSSSPSSLSSSSSSPGLVESLEAAQRELKRLKTTLDVERKQWSDEKTKVINYQKHLQLNYVQMARRNKLLEIEVQQLMMTMTSELDGRRHGNECRRVVKEESLC